MKNDYLVMFIVIAAIILTAWAVDLAGTAVHEFNNRHTKYAEATIKDKVYTVTYTYQFLIEQEGKERYIEVDYVTYRDTKIGSKRAVPVEKKK